MDLGVFSYSCFAAVALHSLIMPAWICTPHQLLPHPLPHPLLIIQGLFASHRNPKTPQILLLKSHNLCSQLSPRGEHCYPSTLGDCLPYGFGFGGGNISSLPVITTAIHILPALEQQTNLQLPGVPRIPPLSLFHGKNR